MHYKLPLYTLVSIFLLLSIILTAQIFETVQAKQVKYQYLEEALISPIKKKNIVKWQEPKEKLARDFIGFNQEKVGQTLSNAWLAYAVSQKGGDIDILQDYFSGVALKRARNAAINGYKNNTKLVTLTLNARPSFFHLDGSLFQAEVESLAVRFAENENGLSIFRSSIDQNITTLVNKSVGWKIFSHERHNIKPIVNEKARSVPRPLTGMNYYPAKTPWRKFWKNYDQKIIEKDLNHIVNIGANSIRIFLPEDDFKGKEKQENLQNLIALLNAAQRRGLYVTPTLFDLKGNYNINQWSQDAQNLTEILTAIKTHQAIAFIDIKNEPDLDFKHHGRAKIEEWLRAMVSVHKHIAPQIPITVGWSADQHAPIMHDVLDLITYHDYKDIEKAKARLNRVIIEAKNKPVMITEIGKSSWSMIIKWPSSEKTQAEILEQHFQSLYQADGIFIWTLHDFPNPDPLAVGSSPWVKNLQSSFGLIDQTGTYKPSAEIVKKAFTKLRKGKHNGQ